MPTKDNIDYRRELQEFAYIVSHDLNAPLRHIRSFGNLLVNKLGPKVTGEEREFLHYMEMSVDKLEAMIAALLDYSRIDTQGEDPQPCECRPMFEATIERFADRIKALDGTCLLHEFPKKILVDTQQFTLLLHHLMDNAIKFHHPDRPLRIDIGLLHEKPMSAEGELLYHFYIKDNGIGITPSQAKHMFKIFNRLPDEHYKGIGAGLAIAKKIIERHGGAIEMEPSLIEAASTELDKMKMTHGMQLNFSIHKSI